MTRAPDWRLCGALTLLLAVAWVALGWVSPAMLPPPAGTAALANGVPRDFGAWQAVSDGVAQVGATAGEAGPTQPYTEQLVRTYRDAEGRSVMLTLAYVAQLTPFTRPHEPEACYRAAGFEVQRRQANEGPLAARRLLAQRGVRREAVTYWIRIAGTQGAGSMAARLELFQAGMRGDAVDGMLVRASVLLAGDDDADTAHALAERFLAELMAASPPPVRRMMKGGLT